MWYWEIKIVPLASLISRFLKKTSMKIMSRIILCDSKERSRLFIYLFYPLSRSTHSENQKKCWLLIFPYVRNILVKALTNFPACYCSTESLKLLLFNSNSRQSCRYPGMNATFSRCCQFSTHLYYIRSFAVIHSLVQRKVKPIEHLQKCSMC